jgi:hypothetical protein
MPDYLNICIISLLPYTRCGGFISKNGGVEFSTVIGYSFNLTFLLIILFFFTDGGGKLSTVPNKNVAEFCSNPIFTTYIFSSKMLGVKLRTNCFGKFTVYNFIFSFIAICGFTKNIY